MAPTSAALVALLLPLAGTTLLAALAGRIGRRGAVAVACGATGLSFLSALAAWLGATIAGAPAPADLVLFRWATVAGTDVRAVLHLDALSLLFMLVVTGVGFLVHAYSAGYMAGDPGLVRYFAYMNLFVFAMLLLVLSGDLVPLLVGWAGVGLASFLLIGFWHERPAAVAAARKAFVINTIGDVAILLAILVTVAAGAGTDIGGLLATASGGVTQGGAAAAVPWDTVAWLLLVGAAAKSAQLPLHTWLPDAMEGPTPVSALLHAATMVTAGVYLVVRFHAVFAAAPTAALAAAAVGMVTALLAATMAAVENDLKRVLAFSTMSQVGYMLGAAAVGALGAAVFHFFTHAFFKALLFLSAGIVIHAAAGEQDMRRLGGLSLARRLPLAYWTFLVGVLAITGAPGFAGFFSKDEILAAFWGTHPVLWGLGAVTAGLTAFYMFRALSLTFLAPPRTEIGTAGGGAGERAPAITAHGDAHLHERVPVSMAWPVMVLAAGAVAAGYVGLPGASLLARFLAPALGGENPPALSPPSLLAALALAAAGFAAAIALYRRGQPAVEARGGVWPSLHRLLAEGYYFDAFYRRVVLGSLQVTAAVCAEVLDPGLIGGVVAGVGWLTALTGRALGFLQSGYTRRYALTVAASAALVLAYFVLASGSGRGPRP